MKKRRFKHEPLDAVRDADPIDRDGLPSAADDPRARALFEQITSLPLDDEAEQPGTAPSTPRWIVRPAWVTATATAMVVGVVGTVAFLGGRAPSDPPPAATSTTTPTDTLPSDTIPTATLPAAGACVEVYDLQTLTNRDFAFDGTVAAIDGDQVTFAVQEWFRDDQGPNVTLTASGLTGGAITPGGGITLVEGERFLVAGSGGFVWPCGFTQPYDSATATAWADALGS